MRKLTLSFFILFVLAAVVQAREYSHAKYVEKYEGTQTCLQCHRQEAENFFYSQHYQWQGPAPNIVNAKNRKLGKINTLNDFCTSPRGNWIGLARNSRGDILSRGCSACHPGLGKLPSEKISQEQLENIDCLICHAAGYRRELYEKAGGGFEWKPILWKNPEGLNSIAQRIALPTRATCLRCHSASGGGPNFKRGDLEYKLADCDKDFDVHMASSGKDMQCVTCHAGKDHRVRGRGADLSGTDLPAQPLSCDSRECHGSTPHKAEALNHHLSRVYCTTCHVPRFAKSDATDMARDWSRPVYHQDLDKYTADITLTKDVKPVYAWYNGSTREQLPGEPVQRLADGSVGIMVPQGSRHDPKARIYAFKLHRGKLPLLQEKNFLIPILVEQFFDNGKIDSAVKGAAKEMYGVSDAKYTWTETTRYMGLFHEVQPASKALQCLDCHAPNGRMDWKALGYKKDPLVTLLSTHATK